MYLKQIRPNATRNYIPGRINRLGKSTNKDVLKIIQNKKKTESFDLSKIEGRWDKACSISGKGVKLDDLKPRDCNFPLGALKDKVTANSSSKGAPAYSVQRTVFFALVLFLPL